MRSQNHEYVSAVGTLLAAVLPFAHQLLVARKSASEVRALEERVDRLEARVAELEARRGWFR